MNRAQKEVQQYQLHEEKRTIEALQKVYEQAREDCERKIRELSSRRDMENLQTIIYQKKYQQALKKQIDDILVNLQREEYASIEDYLNRSYRNGYLGVMYDLHNQGIPLIHPIDQTQVVKAVQTDSRISNGLYTKLGEDVDILKRSIRDELSRGIARGKTWNQMAVQIAKGMNSPLRVAINKTIRIARTEGHRIQQQAGLDSQHAAKNEGADILKQWDATLDGRTREDHKEADGQIRELDEPFDVGGEKMQAPGIGGSARNVCNCRCCMVQRARWALGYGELETLKRRAEFFGLDKTKDFEEFQKKYLKAVQEVGTIKLEDVDPLDNLTNVKEVEDLFKAHGDWFNVQELSGKLYKSVDGLSLNGCDLECAKSIYRVHEMLFDRYPRLKGKLNTVNSGKLAQDVYAQCFFGLGHGGITVNILHFNNADEIQKRYEKDLEYGFHPSGTDYTAIVMHELGHAIDDYLTNIEMAAGVNGWKPKIVSAYLRPKVMKACGLRVSDIGKAVSGYATKNAQEWFAECFAEYMCSENPRPVAMELGKQLEKIMKGVE